VIESIVIACVVNLQPEVLNSGQRDADPLRRIATSDDVAPVNWGFATPHRELDGTVPAGLVIYAYQRRKTGARAPDIEANPARSVHPDALGINLTIEREWIAVETKVRVAPVALDRPPAVELIGSGEVAQPSARLLCVSRVRQWSLTKEQLGRRPWRYCDEQCDDRAKNRCARHKDRLAASQGVKSHPLVAKSFRCSYPPYGRSRSTLDASYL